jgi:hypothetical protein
MVVVEIEPMKRLVCAVHNCIVTLRSFAKRSSAETDQQESVDESDATDMVGQLHALRLYHLSNCVESARGANKYLMNGSEPISEKALRSLWFEYNQTPQNRPKQY